MVSAACLSKQIQRRKWMGCGIYCTSNRNIGFRCRNTLLTKFQFAEQMQVRMSINLFRCNMPFWSSPWLNPWGGFLILDNFESVAIIGEERAWCHGSTAQWWPGNGADGPGRPQAHRRILPLPSGTDGRKQVHLPGVPAADRRPGFQGFLSLHVVLQRLKKVFEKI